MSVLNPAPRSLFPPPLPHPSLRRVFSGLIGSEHCLCSQQHLKPSPSSWRGAIRPSAAWRRPVSWLKPDSHDKRGDLKIRGKPRGRSPSTSTFTAGDCQVGTQVNCLNSEWRLASHVLGFCFISGETAAIIFVSSTQPSPCKSNTALYYLIILFWW